MPSGPGNLNNHRSGMIAQRTCRGLNSNLEPKGYRLNVSEYPKHIGVERAARAYIQHAIVA